MIEFLRTLPSVVDQGLIFGIMAIGIFITFKILDFADLTVDGSFATGGVVFCVMVGLKVPTPLAFAIAFGAGSIAGLVTASLHCFLGIPGILAGILTQLGLWSVNFLILGTQTLPVNRPRGALISMEASSGVYTTIPIVLAISAVLIAILYWFFGTRFGASIRATGANPDMARANGINVNLRKITALMLSNGIVAFAGSIYAQYQGQASVDMGVGSIVIGLAAIIIGTTILGKWGKNFALSLGFTLLGSIIYFFVFQVVLIFIPVPQVLKLISAIVVVLFLGIPYFKNNILANWISKRNRKKEMKEKC